MAILGLTSEELAALCSCLRGAIASPCIPEWEFDSLVGRSRAEALLWVDAGLPNADLDERLLDQVVTMLSMFAGSTEDLDSAAQRDVVGKAQLDQLLEKLCWTPDEQTERKSSVTLRPGVRARVTSQAVTTAAGLPKALGRAVRVPQKRRA